MEHTSISPCRLCLKISNGGFEVLDEMIQCNLNCLQLYLDPTITEEPIICETCAENVRHCLEFKAKCMLNIAPINSLACNKKNQQAVSNDNTGESSNFNTCSFCLEAVKSDSSRLLHNDDSEMLQKFFPELDPGVTERSVACNACYESLQRHFSFIKCCLQTEQKITEFSKIEGTNSKGQVDLDNVANFVSKNILKNDPDGSYAYKIEELYLENGINSDTSSEIKGADAKPETNVKREDAEDIEMELIDSDSSRDEDLPMGATYKCEICAFETKFMRTLLKHMETHKSLIEERMHECTQCNFKTKRRRDLRRHLLDHKSPHEVTMYRCTKCTYETRQKNYFHAHMSKHKSIDEVPMYKCPDCSFETKLQWYLRKHVLKHKSADEVTMYRCTECSYETKYGWYLNTHMLKHKDVGEVPMLKCTKCTFETRRRDSLYKHMLVHKNPEEVTMYRCTMCSYQTKYKSGLRRHKFVHTSTNVSVHRCTECEYETKNRKKLSAHISSHKNGEVKFYNCALCSYQVKSKAYLQKHLLKHNVEGANLDEPFKCTLCTFETTYKYSLERHMTRAHESVV